MLPIVFEWQGSIDRWIFMGLLYIALGLVGFGLVTAFLMTLKNLQDKVTGGQGSEAGREH